MPSGAIRGGAPSFGSGATPDAFNYTANPATGGATTRSAFMGSGKGAVGLSKGSVMGIMALRKDLLQLAGDFGKQGGLRVPLERCIEEVIIPSIKLNFAAEGRPTMWEPVSEDSQYRREHGGGPILQPTGGMARTAVAKARFSVKNNVINYGNWPTAHGHKASRYGYVHDMGGVVTKFGEIPARPFAILQHSDIDGITKVFARWAQERAGKRLRVHYGGF